MISPFYFHSTAILLPFYSHYPTIFDYIHPMIFLQYWWSSRCSDQVFVKSWAKRWLKCKRWYKWLIFRCTEKSGESLNTNLLWDILRTKSFCFGMTVLYPSSYCKQSNIAKMILQKYSWKNAHEKTTWLDQESPRESVWLTVSVARVVWPYLTDEALVPSRAGRSQVLHSEWAIGCPLGARDGNHICRQLGTWKPSWP